MSQTHKIIEHMLNNNFSLDSDSEYSNIIRLFPKRKLLEISEDEESDGGCSDIILPFNKKGRILTSEDETNDGEDIEQISHAHEGIVPFRDTEEDGPSICKEWVWKDEENNSKVWEYIKIPGINELVSEKLGQNVTALKILEEILKQDFWEMLSTETNRYANQVMSIEGRKHEKFEKKWRDTNSDEMKAYFALSILMTQVKKSTLQSYWSKRSIIETPIYKKTMPFWRYAQLTHFLHFTNNEVIDKNDSLRKIRNVIDYLNKNFEYIYKPEENLSIGEFLMKFPGDLSCKQINSSKRASFCIKFYKLCESKSGYCTNFKIYTGQDESKESNNSISEDIVMHLCSPIMDNGYTLFMDSLYSSPKLYINLHARRINVIGTVRHNRRNMPQDLASIELKQYEIVSRSSNGILAVKWKDKEDMYLLSTKHAKAELIKTENKQDEAENAEIPNVVLDYNHGMGGVTTQDNYLSCFSMIRKFAKSYRKIFFYLMDMAFLNAYVLFGKKNNSLKGKKYTFVNFCLDVADEILHNVIIPQYTTQGKASVDNTLLRLQAKGWAHFPRHIPPTQGKPKPQRRCKVCADHKKRSETTWECKKCLVPLHVPDCFEAYHTVQNY